MKLSLLLFIFSNLGIAQDPDPQQNSKLTPDKLTIVKAQKVGMFTFTAMMENEDKASVRSKCNILYSPDSPSALMCVSDSVLEKISSGQIQLMA